MQDSLSYDDDPDEEDGPPDLEEGPPTGRSITPTDGRVDRAALPEAFTFKPLREWA